MTVVMFGMLEVIVKVRPDVKLDRYGNLPNKGDEIKKFLEKYLPQDIKTSIAERYRVDAILNHTKPANFGEVIDYLWEEIRCGFIHEASLESKGLEWHTVEGIGTKEQPIILRPDVPVQEWLQVTWQAILNSYGYTGLLELPRYKK